MNNTSYNLDNNQFLARLQLKRFAQQYTPIKAELFPKGELDKLYAAIDCKIEDAPEPFTVVANSDGTFKALYSPVVVQKENVLVVKMGLNLVPLSDRVSVTFLESSTGICASLTCNKKAVVLPVFIKEGVTVSANQLNDSLDNLSSYIAEAKVGGETRSRYSIKLSDLPLKTYQVINYSIFEGSSYDTLYLRAIATEILENVNAYDSEVKEAKTVTIQPQEIFTILGNSKLLTLFRANPIVSNEHPALLTVVGTRLVMGKITADVKIELSSVELFEDDIDF